jgi:quercetin dioxygenase-like cupin family protein
MHRVLAFAAFVAVSGPALAQAPAPAPAPFERVPLRTIEWPPGYNATSMVVKIQPNGVIPRHTHPGVESGYLQDGEIVLSVAGKPDETAKAGGSWMVPAEAVHSAKAGPAGATAIVNYVVDKTKPISSPAP